ncbi:MAG: hypothetical protein ACE5IC_06670 [Candidatus Brocadiales bacterium]
MSGKEEVIKKIKSKGYWAINLHPDIYIKERIESRAKVKEIVRNSVIELRGWYYPHFKDRISEPSPSINGVEKFIDWRNHIEFWRMTQSGNFVHLLALREDWLEDIEYRNIWSHGDELKGKKLLGALGTLYTLTEIFEFAKRLAKEDIFDEKVVIKVELHDLLDRHLFIDSYDRVPFMAPPVSKEGGPWKCDKSYAVTELMNKANEFAFEAFLNLVDLFGWENPPTDNLKNDQQKFLEGKL